MCGMPECAVISQPIIALGTVPAEGDWGLVINVCCGHNNICIRTMTEEITIIIGDP